MTNPVLATARYVGVGVRTIGDVKIGPNCIIEDYCIIGKPTMHSLSRALRDPRHDITLTEQTKVGTGCTLGAGTKIYAGSMLEDEVETEDDVRIGWNATIGRRSRLMYRAQVYCGVVIGIECRVAGFVGDNTVFGDRVSSFGSFVHDYPHHTTTYEPRPSAVVGDEVIVGWGAVIVGGVRIGRGAYLAANALVTRDVPEDHVAFGVNKLCRKDSWAGRLGDLAQDGHSATGVLGSTTGSLRRDS